MNKIAMLSIIARTGSLTSAAEVLNISQPALSKAMRVLAHELDLKLTIPEGRGLRLTEEAQQLLARAMPLLEQWQQLSQQIRQENPSRPQTSLRLATFEVFSTHFLARLMQDMPQWQLTLLESMPGGIEQLVLNGQADCGITYIPVPSEGIVHLKVAKLQMGAFGHARFARLPMASWPFVVPLPTSGTVPTKVQGLDGWPDDRKGRRIAHRVQLMESALELCRMGSAVAYLPNFVVNLHNQKHRAQFHLEELTLPFDRQEAQVNVYLVTKANRSEEKTHRVLAKIIRGLNS